MQKSKQLSMKAQAYKDTNDARHYWIVFEDMSVLHYHESGSDTRRNDWLGGVFIPSEVWTCTDTAEITQLLRREIGLRKGYYVADFEVPDVLHAEIRTRWRDAARSSMLLTSRRMTAKFLDDTISPRYLEESERIVEQKEKELESTIHDVYAYLAATLI